MRYRLSKFIPVRFHSTYVVLGWDAREQSTWWQWRGRIFRHRRSAV